jgi:hypothetical protein
MKRYKLVIGFHNNIQFIKIHRKHIISRQSFSPIINQFLTLWDGYEWPTFGTALVDNWPFLFITSQNWFKPPTLKKKKCSNKSLKQWNQIHNHNSSENCSMPQGWAFNKINRNNPLNHSQKEWNCFNSLFEYMHKTIWHVSKSYTWEIKSSTNQSNKF